MKYMIDFGVLVAFLIAGTAAAADAKALAGIENDALRISLAGEDASLTVTDKRIGLVWRQQVTHGFQVIASSVKQTPGNLSAEVTGGGGPYSLTIRLTPDRPHGFDLAIDIPGRKYTTPPLYPFPFVAPQSDWSYVQNTTGEGMLMPVSKPDEIKDLDQWNGGQPWWGLTDGNRSMSARLDSFRSQAARTTVYAVPMRIHYDFFIDGGYQRLAKEYRKDFLRSNPEMEKLAQRVRKRAAVASLKDGVYVYLWGDSPAEDLNLVREMNSAGVKRGIAVFYGRHEVDRALFDGIKELGWVAGMYKMPTGNLFQVSKRRGWPADLLVGKAAPERFLASSNLAAWGRVCAKHLLPEWTEKASL